MEESHLCNLPFEHGIKSLWRLVVCYREWELTDLKYQKKKLNLCELYTRSPRKSIRGASTQLQIPCSTIHKVLHRKLRLYAYKVQLLQPLKPEDKPRRKEFAVMMLDRLDSDPGFLKRVCFSEESTFCVSGLLNRHNLKIWGSKNPHDACELE